MKKQLIPILSAAMLTATSAFGGTVTLSSGELGPIARDVFTQSGRPVGSGSLTEVAIQNVRTIDPYAASSSSTATAAAVDGGLVIASSRTSGFGPIKSPPRPGDMRSDSVDGASVVVVPLPPAVFAGIALLGVAGVRRMFK